MTLPQRNATLTRVAAASAAESYDGPAVAGPEKWAGQADAYLRERRDRDVTTGGGARTIDRLLIVEATLPIDFRSGDTVTFTPTGASEQTADVRLVERHTIDDPEIDPDLQTTRLTLETT